MDNEKTGTHHDPLGEVERLRTVALIGLVRVTADPGEAALQRAALEPICLKVLEEPTSRHMLIENRPALMDAIAGLEDGDELTVERLTALGPGRTSSYIVLARLFDRGIRVRILTGYASRAPLGDLVEYGSALDSSRAVAQRAAIHSGQQRARVRGTRIGRPSSMSEKLVETVRERRSQGESLRAIAAAVGVSRGTVANVLRMRQ